PFLLIFLWTGCLANSEPTVIPVSEEEKIPASFRKLTESTFYYYVGTALESASLLGRFGWGLCHLSPWASTLGKDCLFLSRLCDSAAKHVFAQMFKGSSSFEKIPLSQTSWHLNKTLLSQIPAFSKEDEQLLHFLEKRWLAKATGFFSSMIDWVCPCFGVTVQVHPETASCCYVRSPSIKLSPTYQNRMEDWKQSLPHPQEFPLILTRPFDLQEYLPACIEVSREEKIETVVERIALKMADNSKIIVDLTHVLPDNDREKWLSTWKAYCQQFTQACMEHHLNPGRILCIQRMQQESIGGIRLLPLSQEELGLQYQFLLEWISHFGLSANLIELDRWPFPSQASIRGGTALTIELPSKDEFVSYLNSFTWKSTHVQKNLMVTGTLQVLKNLLENLSEKKWNEIINCPTRSSIAQLSFLRIKEQLQLLSQEKDGVTFFETAGHVEQIHANLSSLLEIFAPFTSADFPPIYRDLLTSIPSNLKQMTSYGVHASGMTSLAGVFKAVERTLGKAPRILYGENTYYECIIAANLVSNVSSIEKANESDWKEVDLILAQFNPVLRTSYPATDYRNEKIAEILHKSLNIREGKPLTLALDCTIDFIDSSRVGSLLAEFQQEIEKGTLNIICYRSGLKFDLFGMDNYCGAPFYMIHSQSPTWAAFDALLSDPVLQTDRLSLNWFCLAYQSAAPQLELYRKQIFDNTRAFLSKVPSRLLNKNSHYRIIPVEEGADPAFVDIKISGPLHQMRGSALVGGNLSIKCLEGGHPIFYRPSLGLYHPNFTMLFNEDHTTVRLTIGLDPAQIDLLVNCFKMIDSLN
ncbi:MAG TPA: hypothetical protein VMR37_08075, partial [Rhabdochlamydiaceae bacterium]|nr:hypothetical protein [Rhabdochlamydiaceae bacterium]